MIWAGHVAHILEINENKILVLKKNKGKRLLGR
jgi:hypothetical protein